MAGALSEREVRFLALQIVVQLPLGHDDAKRVLTAAGEFEECWLNAAARRLAGDKPDRKLRSVSLGGLPGSLPLDAPDGDL
jgi:hypothetical protein